MKSEEEIRKRIEQLTSDLSPGCSIIYSMSHLDEMTVELQTLEWVVEIGR